MADAKDKRMSTQVEANAPSAANGASATLRTCGLIMPISPIDGLPAEHWVDVRAILTEAVESITDPRFSVALVSDADETGIIQKRIVQNVYGSDVVVCDVSGKNPNVMFELGMRLAFNKPVVIVKDSKTDYSFDTGIIEHLTYPRDLRFGDIVHFKAKLAVKLVATDRAARAPNHPGFLDSFGTFKVAHLKETEVSPERLTLDAIEDLRKEVRRLAKKQDAARGANARERYMNELGNVLLSLFDSETLTHPERVLSSRDRMELLNQRLQHVGFQFSDEETFRIAVEEALSNLTSRLLFTS